MYCNLAGQHSVVLNTHKAGTNLFDKKGSIYCDRLYMTMASSLVGWKENILDIASCDDRTKRLRAIMLKHFGNKSTLRGYTELLEAESRRFMGRLLDDEQPADRLSEHIRT